MEFYERLRKSRIEHGFSSKEMAKLLGIAVFSYSQYENGKREPDVARIKNMAKLLNTTTDYLIGLVNLPNETYIPVLKNSNKPLTHDEAAFVLDYRELNELGKTKARDYINDLNGNAKYKK